MSEDPANYDTLPAIIRELTDLIGPQPTQAIIALRGGLRLYIPADAHPDHWLIPHIGFEAFAKLVLEYGREYLEIPRCAASLRQARYDAIISAAAQGTSVATLAKQHHLTMRRIHQIKATQRVTGLPGQGQLEL